MFLRAVDDAILPPLIAATVCAATRPRRNVDFASSQASLLEAPSELLAEVPPSCVYWVISERPSE